MSNQQINQKLGNAAKTMQGKVNSSLLSDVKTFEVPDFKPRFCKNTRTDYNRALFEAALTGNVRTLDALARQCSATNQLIDETGCDNALWVAVAENHTEFAKTLLKAKGICDKITMSGVKEAIKLTSKTQDKELIRALLRFVAESSAAREETLAC